MPRPSRRSRTLRRIYVKTPKQTKLVYAKRKHNKAHCAKCGKVLPGVATASPYKLSKLSKTEKRPERPYAGVLCSSCTRKTIKSKIE
ncbi:MAG: 50S ribosomal protein L34e [Candidatus Woesearchaeota archaeon]|nr:MAG: 50S ribosomal protein L34e [Candidatus Woesearchaeota archaeon]